MDEKLVRYLLDDLPAGDRAAVDDLAASDPAVAAKLARLRRVLTGLSADHPVPVPPPGLAAIAVARTAEYLVANGLFKTDSTVEWLMEPPPKPIAGRAAAVIGWRRWVGDPVVPSLPRADLIVAATIGFLAVGIGLSAIGKFRHDSRILACQDNLRGLHTSLVGYADTHSGRFPEVGTPTVPVAGAFPAELVRAGQLWSPAAAACPTAALDPEFAPAGGYAYTLGYRTPNGLVVGPRRADTADGVTDWTPLAADPIGPAGSPHGAGQNVLYAGGNVRYATTPIIPEADDIYRNDDGLVRAGLHRRDTSLGTAAAVP